MNTTKNIVKYIILLGIGIVLLVLGVAEIVDEYWSGMGGGFIAISILRLVRLHRLNKDENYREKFETEVSDERNRFLRNKAWAWTGYLFIIITGIAVIVLKVMGQDLLAQVASYCVCLMIVLYWVSYLILRKKY